MIGVIAISLVSIAGLIASILFLPSVRIGKVRLSTYWIMPLLGGIALLASGLLSLDSFLGALFSSSAVNPLQILAIFFSMVFMSIVLDEVGFFRYLASVAAKKAKKSQILLFLLLYLFVSVLTVFTSNDIIVITFTPFIIFFARHAKISPLPYLIGEFVAANTWSALLLVGNPTNIYLASSFGIDFLAYLERMFLPTLCAGGMAMIVIFLLFAKKLRDPIEIEPTSGKIIDMPIFAVSASLLSICIVLIAISSWINLPMWMAALGSAVILFAFVFVYGLINKKEFFVTTDSLRRLPYDLAPLLLGMFAIVLALEESGFTALLFSALGNEEPILVYGLSSFLAANLVNNIPMSVLFAEILKEAATVNYQAVYACILSSNVAAFFTPVGALAGVMWMGLIKQNHIHFTFLRFVGYGSLIAIPTLLAGLGGLYLSFLLFP